MGGVPLNVIADNCVLAQWQMKDGKLVKEVIWAAAAKTANIAIN